YCVYFLSVEYSFSVEYIVFGFILCLYYYSYFFFFFFQAEDGIRDATVTGVQTCALPISPFLRAKPRVPSMGSTTHTRGPDRAAAASAGVCSSAQKASPGKRMCSARRMEIGRASCRERVEMSVVGGSGKKKGEQRSRRVYR